MQSRGKSFGWVRFLLSGVLMRFCATERLDHWYLAVVRSSATERLDGAFLLYKERSKIQVPRGTCILLQFWVSLYCVSSAHSPSLSTLHAAPFPFRWDSLVQSYKTALRQTRDRPLLHTEPNQRKHQLLGIGEHFQTSHITSHVGHVGQYHLF